MPNTLIAIKDRVFVTNLEHGERKTSSGIIIRDDNMREHGIRERWAKVYAVGPDVRDDLKPGEWVLLKHGRWSPRMTVETDEGPISVWLIDYPDAVLLVSEDDPR